MEEEKEYVKTAADRTSVLILARSPSARTAEAPRSVSTADREGCARTARELRSVSMGEAGTSARTVEASLFAPIQKTDRGNILK